MKSVIKTVLFVLILLPVLAGIGYFFGTGLSKATNISQEADFFSEYVLNVVYITAVSFLFAISAYFFLRLKKQSLKEKGKISEEERMFEPFFGAGTDDRIRVLASLALLGSLPIIITYILLENLSETWKFMLFGGSVFILILLVAVYSIILFRKTREFFDKYELIITPVVLFFGFFSTMLYLVTMDRFNLPEQYNFGKIALALYSVTALIVGGKLLLLANRTIYDKKAKAEEELNFASEIQEQFLQDRETDSPFLKGYGISRAAREVGGDFLFLDKKNDNTVVAATGDVSGHSFGAGLIMSMLSTMIEDHLRYKDTSNGLLEILNHKLYQQPKRNIFSTMNCAEADRDKVLLWNAGHMPLIKYSASSGDIEDIRHPGVALGMTTGIQYNPLEIPADNDDIFILYSDGLVETRNKQGDIREENHFYEKVVEVLNSENSCSDIAEAIIQKTLDDDFNDYPEDDMTIIVLQYKATN